MLHAVNQATWCGLLALGLEFLYMGHRIGFDRNFTRFGSFLLLTSAAFFPDAWMGQPTEGGSAFLFGTRMAGGIGIALLAFLFLVFRRMSVKISEPTGQEGTRRWLLVAGGFALLTGVAADFTQATLMKPGPVGSWSLVGAGVVAASGTWVLLSRFLEQNRENRMSMERLASAYDLLQEQARFREIGSSAAIISHEIRNYVSALKGNAVLMGTAAGESGKGTQVEAIRLAADRLDIMSRDIASVGAFPDRSGETAFDLENLIRSCFRRHFRGWDGSLLITAQVGLPGLKGDPDRLEQVFINLVRNSIEAGASRIDIRLRTWGGRFLLGLEDNGAGCGFADLSKIGLPFFTSRDGRGGTGLGCSIAATILKSHDASFRIYSKNVLGRGHTGLVVNAVFPDAVIHDGPWPAAEPGGVVVATGTPEVRSCILPPLLNLGIRPLLLPEPVLAMGLHEPARRKLLLGEKAWVERLLDSWKQGPTYAVDERRVMRPIPGAAGPSMLLTEETLAGLLAETGRR